MTNETRLFAMVAMAACAVTAVADGERNQYYCAITGGGCNYYKSDWTSTTGSAVAADKGCDLTIVHLYSDNKGYSDNLDCYSVTVAKTNDTSSFSGPWLDSTGTLTIREGGLIAEANNLIRFTYWTDLVRVKLAESQTWRGPATGTTYGEIDIGSDNTWSGNYYYHAQIIALKDLTWTLDGRMRVCIASSNDLSNVDIVVNPQARLFLQAKCNGTTSLPFLNAKSLTLKGGDTGTSIPMLTLAKANPSSKFANATAPTTFDDATLSPKVFLVDGASVDNGGTVDYGVSELSVSGGDSTFSGTVAFKKPVAIDIASGASLAFTGTVSADDGAGIDLTGGGSLKFTKNFIMVPVSGDGTIRCDPGAGGETMLNGDISSFTGTIYVASGTLLIHPNVTVNPAATITTAAGATVHYMDANDFGDFTTADGKTYYRDSTGLVFQHLYMNGFSGNTGWGDISFREVPDVEQEIRWVQGLVCVIDRRMGGGIGNWYKINVKGIIVESTATLPGGNYFDGGYDFTIGERGIEFRSANGKTLSFYKSFNYFKLSESQTWKGPAAETLSSSPARINVGGDWNYIYPTGALTAMKDLDLTLEGDLNTGFYYPTNDMTRINLIVKKPAKITLTYPGGHSSYTSLPTPERWVGRLNAKSLTFDGAVAMTIDYSSNYPTMSSEFLARKIILKNGAAFSLSDKKWTGITFAAGAGNGAMTGTYTLLDDVFNLEAEAGATLDVTGATFAQAPGTSTSLALTGPGTIRLALGKLNMFNGIAVDGAALELTGSGSWTAPLASAGGLTIDSSETIYVSAAALAGYTPTEINVTSGTLVIDSVFALPQGCKVVTSGTGALSLADPDGFDADVHMGGTKNIVADSSLIVTDAARENESLTVAAGQTLHVFGSGLKASSSVSLEAGASIVFHETATIYAPVAITGAATIISDGADVEGTFAGAVTAGNETTATGACNIWAPGGIVFAGGGNVYRTPICQRSGRIEFRSKQFSFRKSNGGFAMYAGHCIITNCTAYSITDGDWYLDKSDQTADVTLEVAKGGTLKLDNNSRIYIGRSTNCVSRLLLNGGTFTHATYDTMYINQYGNGNGVFEFVAGNFTTQRRFITGFKPGTSVGSAKFIWRGGTWSTTSGGYPYQFYHLIQSSSADSGLEFIVAGTNCVLDLSYFKYPQSISNFNAGVSRMIGMPGAKLTIKGKKNVASNMTFVRFTPNGMALDLNPVPSCNVDIEGDGNDIELGWVLPGTGGVVRCIGTASPLKANYVVPSGFTFRNDYIGDGWYSGFASAAAHDLVFGDGSTYLLRTTAQGLAPISITGAVVTSGTVRYDVDKSGGALPEGEGITLVNATEGCEGDGTWAAANGTLGRKTRIYGGEGALLFDHKPIPFRIYFR